MSQSFSANDVCQRERSALLEKSQIEPEVLAVESKKVFGVVVDGEAKAGPIVHGAAAEVFVAEDESQRADEMELGSGGDAGAGDVSGVGGDLWLEEGDFQVVGTKLGERVVGRCWRAVGQMR
jgi:hypothetical protein